MLFGTKSFLLVWCYVRNLSSYSGKVVFPCLLFNTKSTTGIVPTFVRQFGR